MSDDRARRELERLLGTTLPPSVKAVRFHRWKPSTDLALFTAYARLEGPRAAYDDVVRALGLAPRGSAGAAGRLPASWSLEPGLSLDWWDASRETPDDAAGRSWGTNGWIVAKYEDGAVYLIATDTGSDVGSGGAG